MRLPRTSEPSLVATALLAIAPLLGACAFLALSLAAIGGLP